MPYRKPPERIRHLPPEAQDIWVAAYNAAYEQYDGDEAIANAVAWAAVKKAGYYQDEDGKWKKREKMTAAEDEERARIVGYDVSTTVSMADDGPQAPEWIRLLPYGLVELNDGRPPIRVTREAVQRVVERFRERGVDMVVDYEHQTMSGDRAPAAGWIKELEARDDGLWARVDWTERARDYIRSREYRYFSPTVRLDQDRNLVDLLHVGLTNFPAMRGIPALAAKTKTDGGITMLDKLSDLLGLPGTATEAEIYIAVRDMAEKVRELENLKRQADLIAETLGLKNRTSLAESLTRIEGLKLAAGRVLELEEQVQHLRQQQEEAVAERLIEEALATGRTTPAELEAHDGKLRQLARQDPEFFKVLILGRPEGSAVPLQKLPKYERAKQQEASPEELPPVVRRILETARLGVEHYRQQVQREQQGEPFVGFWPAKSNN